MQYLFDAPTDITRRGVAGARGPVEPWFVHGHRVAPRSVLFRNAVVAAGATAPLLRAMAAAQRAAAETRGTAPPTFADRLDAELRAVDRTLRRHGVPREALTASAGAPAPVKPRRIPMAYMTPEELTALMSPREQQRQAKR